MANRINVDTVVQLVSDDIRSAIRFTVTDKASAEWPAAAFWSGSTFIADASGG